MTVARPVGPVTHQSVSTTARCVRRAIPRCAGCAAMRAIPVATSIVTLTSRTVRTATPITAIHIPGPATTVVPLGVTSTLSSAAAAVTSSVPSTAIPASRAVRCSVMLTSSTANRVPTSVTPAIAHSVLHMQPTVRSVTNPYAWNIDTVQLLVPSMCASPTAQTATPVTLRMQTRS